MSPVAAAPGDIATDQLFAVHSGFYGELDRAAFDEEVIANTRLVATLQVTRLRGVMTAVGRRLVDGR